MSLQMFNLIKPQIELGISMTTLWLRGPLKDRIFILAIYVVNFMCLISAIVHATVNFDGVTFNFVITFVIVTGVMQNFMKTLTMLRRRNSFAKLLMWAQSLHELHSNTNGSNYEHSDDAEVSNTIEFNLQKFMKIFLMVNKCITWMLTFNLVGLSFVNVIMGKSGIFLYFPFISVDSFFFLPLIHFLQFILSLLIVIHIRYTETTVVFIGLEIMAAVDTLNQLIAHRRDDIYTKPSFLKVILQQHCDIIDNMKHFSGIISMVALAQFLSGLLFLLMGFICVRMNPNHPLGYVLSIGALAQPLWICAFAEFIQIKANKLSANLYKTNWYDLNYKDQKNFLLILGMMQKTYGLRAAGMYDINITLFITILKLAMSYCTILLTFSK